MAKGATVIWSNEQLSAIHNLIQTLMSFDKCKQGLRGVTKWRKAGSVLVGTKLAK